MAFSALAFLKRKSLKAKTVGTTTAGLIVINVGYNPVRAFEKVWVFKKKKKQISECVISTKQL